MFSLVLTLILFAIITLNILEYIRILLKLSPLLQIYWQPFDWPNLTYIVSQIRKNNFKDLVFLLSSAGTIKKSLKTMIFVDKIDDIIEMAKYLQSRFSECIWSILRVDNIICTFLANLQITTRTRFLGDF